MPKKQSIETLLRRSLGKDAADAVLAKIDGMVASRATPAAIEKAVTADLQRQFVQQVVSAAVSGIGPVTPVKVRGIQAKVRPVMIPIIARSPIIIAKSAGVQARPGHRRLGRTSKARR